MRICAHVVCHQSVQCLYAICVGIRDHGGPTFGVRRASSNSGRHVVREMADRSTRIPPMGINFTREMAIGNTFGAVTFCSYGSYWVASAIITWLDEIHVVGGNESELCQKHLLMAFYMMVNRSLPPLQLHSNGIDRRGSSSPL